jgi:hypothetical protein
MSRQETVTNPSVNFVRQLRQTGARVRPVDLVTWSCTANGPAPPAA